MDGLQLCVEMEKEETDKRIIRTASRIPGLDHILRTTQITGPWRFTRTAEIQTLTERCFRFVWTGDGDPVRIVCVHIMCVH